MKRPISLLMGFMIAMSVLTVSVLAMTDRTNVSPDNGCGGKTVNRNIRYVGMSIWWYDGRVLGGNGNGSGEIACGFQTLLDDRFDFKSTTNYCYSGYSLGALDASMKWSVLCEAASWIGEEGDIWTLDTITNDFYRDIPIGSIADYDNNTGVTTFYGALRLFHDRVIELSGEDAVVICSNALRRNSAGYTSHSTNGAGHTLGDYDAAVRTVAELNGWYFVDQFHDSGVTEENLYELTIDGLHLNNEGYKLAVLPWVKAFSHFAHDYASVVTEPTCTEKGYTTHTCVSCGDSCVDGIVPAKGHDFRGGSCVMCGVVNPFADVNDSDWFYSSVIWAVQNDVTQGTSAALFSPNAPCTRAQVVTFLWAAAGKPKHNGGNNPFRDVEEEDWYCNAVLWAAEQGITDGTSPYVFSPDVPCTRAQVATFLYAAAGRPNVENGNLFVDVPEDAWYKVSVNWAWNQKITEGVGNNRFAPDGTCTRSQIVTFLHQASKLQ